MYSLRQILVGGAVMLLMLAPLTSHTRELSKTGFGARIKISGLVVKNSQDSPEVADEDRQSVSLDVSPWMHVAIGDDWRFYSMVQLFSSTELTPLESDEGGGLADSFLRLRQLWLDYGGLTPYPGESLRLGLQRLRSEDGLWWDTDIEALVWRFDTTLLKGKAGVAQRFATYRTDRGDLDQEDQDRFNLLGALSYQWRPQQWLGTRFHYQKDRDGLARTGERLAGHDRRLEREAFWLGLAASGRIGSPAALTYWFQGLGMIGQQQVLSTDSQVDHNLVTGSRSQDIRAWGVDLGLRYRLPVRPRIEIGAAYAQGSGGQNEDESNEFAQTGLQSNRSRFTGGRSRVYRFGEILRPELRNLSVATVFATALIDQSYEGMVLFHSFYRNDTDDGIVSTLFDAPLVNTSHEVGREIDLYLSYFWRSWQWLGRKSRAYVRLRSACFIPGSGYGDDADDPVYRFMLDLYLLF